MRQASRLLRSNKDLSSNFVTPYGKGYLESRLVMRPPGQNHNNHLSLYVSSHSGCMLACEMCHLTHSEQQSFLPADQEHFSAQIRLLLEHYKERQQVDLPKSEWAYINFMARGEPLLNPQIQKNLPAMYKEWEEICQSYDLKLRVNISSILPKGIQRFESLKEIFGPAPINLYYSLYSLETPFREKWLQNSMDPEKALGLLKNWEEESGIPVTFHWAVIKGHNDSKECVDGIADKIEEMGFKGRFHLVQFNTPSEKYEEADQENLDYAFKRLSGAFPNSKSKSIRRIGEDVYASCGTFWSPLTETE